MKDINVGDIVLIWDPISKKTIGKPVLWMMKKQTGFNNMIHFTLEDNLTIGITPEHYVFSPLLDSSMSAKELKIGDYLPTVNGMSKIKDIVMTKESVTYAPFTGYQHLICNGIISNNYMPGCSCSVSLCDQCKANSNVVQETCDMYDEIYSVYLSDPTLKNLKHIAMVYGCSEIYHSILYSENPKATFIDMIQHTSQEELDKMLHKLEKRDGIKTQFTNQN